MKTKPEVPLALIALAIAIFVMGALFALVAGAFCL